VTQPRLITSHRPRGPRGEAGATWDWPEDDTPLCLDDFVLRRWQAHTGDSVIVRAFPQRPNGAIGKRPTYLLKYGADAIGERIYSVLARRLRLPSEVVRWTSEPTLLEAAIRFEPRAHRPRRIDPAHAIATDERGRGEPIHNPLDYAAHLALSQVLGEADGVEVMLRDGVLFRIDAADVGSGVFSAALAEHVRRALDPAHSTPLPQSRSGGPLHGEESRQGSARDDIRDDVRDDIRDDIRHSSFSEQLTLLDQIDPAGREAYAATLRALLEREDELASAITDDLLAAPGASALVAPYPGEPLSAQPVAPLMPGVVSAFSDHWRRACETVRAVLSTVSI
jgi:hypothetical protein